jgi:hypothetical protein
VVNVARRAEEPIDPAVVLTNPDDNCSAASFAAFLSELLAEPEPERESLNAADALKELRADS